MKYVVSDIHGNYELLVKLLNKIKFTRKDTLFVLGDVIDKGKDVEKLLNLLFKKLSETVIVLGGNHEFEFIKYVKMLIKNDATDDEILKKSREFLGVKNISFEDIENLMNLPWYYEEKDFILVHAGIAFDDKGEFIPLEKTRIEDFVYDRKFKNENFLPKGLKCVIFGHTPTFNVSGKKGKIIKYKKEKTIGNSVKDYYKIQIDTGNYLTGVLGCLRLDDMNEFYVSEFEN